MSRRPTIAGMLGLVLICGATLAGLRSGSNDWFKLIYTLTFLVLIYAAIAARHRGPVWFGAAVAGWSYFVVGFGPWIGGLPGVDPLRVVNRNLVTSFLVEVATASVERFDPPLATPGFGPMRIDRENRRANRDGVVHCALTILFAFGGGLVSRRLARPDGGPGARSGP